MSSPVVVDTRKLGDGTTEMRPERDQVGDHFQLFYLYFCIFYHVRLPYHRIYPFSIYTVVFRIRSRPQQRSYEMPRYGQDRKTTRAKRLGGQNKIAGSLIG